MKHPVDANPLAGSTMGTVLSRVELEAFLRVVCLERDESFFTRAISHAMDGTKDPDAERLRRARECLRVLEQHRPK